jgi:hypothetical protein
MRYIYGIVTGVCLAVVGLDRILGFVEQVVNFVLGFVK